MAKPSYAQAGGGNAGISRRQPARQDPDLIDGDLTVTESPAIVAYLAERYSTPVQRLIPEGIEQRALYFELMLNAATVRLEVALKSGDAMDCPSFPVLITG